MIAPASLLPDPAVLGNASSAPRPGAAPPERGPGFAALLHHTQLKAVPGPATPPAPSAPADPAGSDAPSIDASRPTPPERPRTVPRPVPRTAATAPGKASDPDPVVDRLDREAAGERTDPPADPAQAPGLTPGVVPGVAPPPGLPAAPACPRAPAADAPLAHVATPRADDGVEPGAPGPAGRADPTPTATVARPVRAAEAADPARADAPALAAEATGPASPFAHQLEALRVDAATVTDPARLAAEPATGAAPAAGALALAATPFPPGRDASVPVAVALPTPAASPEFPQALGVQVSLLARDGVQHAELHLNPAETGPVSVQIVVDGSQARVDFGADLASTRQAIEASLPGLAAALRDAGLTLSGGGVSQHARGRGDPGSDGRSGQPARRVAGIEAAEGDAPVRTSHRTGRIGGLDLYA